MSALADGYREELLDAVFGASHFAGFPTPMYAALWQVIPDAAGAGGTEVPNANAYARVLVSNNGTNWPAAAANLKANGAAITFPEATGSWGTVAAMTFHTAAGWGGGVMILRAALGTPVAVGDENAPYFPIGDLTFMVP